MSVSTRLTLSSRCSDTSAKNSDGNNYFGSLAALLGGKSEKKVAGEKSFTVRTVILVSLAAAGGTTSTSASFWRAPNSPAAVPTEEEDGDDVASELEGIADFEEEMNRAEEELIAESVMEAVRAYGRIITLPS